MNFLALFNSEIFLSSQFDSKLFMKKNTYLSFSRQIAVLFAEYELSIII